MNNLGRILDTKRIPLPIDHQLCIEGKIYIVQDVISFGGSCIAYLAKQVSNNLEASIGLKAKLTVIKEFYPYELSNSIKRDGGALSIAPKEQLVFDKLKKCFENGIVNQVAYYSEDSNKSLPPAQIGWTNSTVYSVVDLTQGNILENCRTTLSMYEISEIMISLCNAVKNLHNSKRLYLDLKPSNIFLFNKDIGESRRIALFDFDTLLSINEIKTRTIPFTIGWSPYEQQYNKINDISYASDIYAIGAIFYWLISGREVTNQTLDDIHWKDYSFLDECILLKNMKNARTISQYLLSKTLNRVSKERAQDVGALLDVNKEPTFSDLKATATTGDEPVIKPISDKIDEANSGIVDLSKRIDEYIKLSKTETSNIAREKEPMNTNIIKTGGKVSGNQNIIQNAYIFGGSASDIK